MQATRDSRKLKFIFLVLLPTLIMGCTVTHSKHPLSDEETSELDERLIGHWRPDSFENRLDLRLAPFVVGRVKGSPKLLEGVSTSLTKDEQVKVSRNLLFTRSIEGGNYISAKATNKNQVIYVIIKYQVDERETEDKESTELRLFAMDPDFVAKAIYQNKLPGKANWYESPDKPDAKAAWVSTTASQEQLIAFIKKHPQKAFEKHPFVVLKKFQPRWQLQRSK